MLCGKGRGQFSRAFWCFVGCIIGVRLYNDLDCIQILERPIRNMSGCDIRDRRHYSCPRVAVYASRTFSCEEDTATTHDALFFVLA